MDHQLDQMRSVLSLLRSGTDQDVKAVLRRLREADGINAAVDDIVTASFLVDQEPQANKGC